VKRCKGESELSSESEHDTLLRLTAQVEQHAEQLQLLVEHDRTTLVSVTRLDGHLDALQQSHEAIQAALGQLQQQQADDREDSHEQFRNLDRKISLNHIELRDHFDEKIDSWQAALDVHLRAEREALPQWAKVRLMKWSVSVAVIAIIISLLEFLRILPIPH